ncbi:MAG: hypothetical protein ACREXK_04895, partial [Gammaproteobacteria bacterium]
MAALGFARSRIAEHKDDATPSGSAVAAGWWCRVEMWRGGLGLAYLFPALSFAGASLATPCSVSTSRSSNWT